MSAVIKSARPRIFLGIEDVISLARPDLVYPVLNGIIRGRTVTTEAACSLFSPDACTNLRLLQTEFNAQFVVTSGWADVLKKTEMSALLTQAGLTFIVENLHRHWCSPFSEWSCRRDEIEDWLRLHGRTGGPFVIIDAESTSASLLNSHLFDSTVFCDKKWGFSLAHLDRAREIFRLQI